MDICFLYEIRAVGHVRSVGCQFSIDNKHERE